MMKGFKIASLLIVMCFSNMSFSLPSSDMTASAARVKIQNWIFQLNNKDIKSQESASFDFNKFVDNYEDLSIEVLLDIHAFPHLIKVLKKTKSHKVQMAITNAIMNLCYESEACQQAFYDEGALPVLINLLRSRHLKVSFSALSVFTYLDQKEIQDYIRRKGVLSLFINFLKSADLKTREEALWAIYSATDENSKSSRVVCKKLGETKGAINFLVALFADSEEPTIYRKASRLLSSLIRFDHKNLEKIINAEAIHLLTKTLIETKDSTVQKHIMSTLKLIATGSYENQRDICVAGASSFLIRLIENNKSEKSVKKIARAFLKEIIDSDPDLVVGVPVVEDPVVAVSNRQQALAVRVGPAEEVVTVVGVPL